MAQEEGAEQQSRRVRAARQRAARERVERLEQAIEELKKVEEKKSKQPRGAAARVSESEPEARVQRESNGGLAAGYNAQLATGASEKIVVGVKLTNEAADVGQLEATLQDVERRLGEKPQQVVADQGYASRANVQAMQQAEVKLLTPPPEVESQSKAARKSAGIDEAFGPEAFVYDESSDRYQCPGGKEFRLPAQLAEAGPEVSAVSSAGVGLPGMRVAAAMLSEEFRTGANAVAGEQRRGDGSASGVDAKRGKRKRCTGGGRRWRSFPTPG